MAEPIRVLYVGDDDDFAGSVAESLGSADDSIEVVTATTLEGGLDRLSGSDVDCIVSEYALPDRDGLAFLEALREEDAALPFFLLVGADSDSIASEAISAGVTDYLAKPDLADEFSALVERIRASIAQERTERDERETREWFSTLLEHSSDVILVVNENGIVTYIAPSVERFIGYPPDELTDSSAFDIVHPADIEQAFEAFKQTLESPNEDITVEFRAHDAHGKIIWLEVTGRNLLDDPVVEGILVNVRDVTDRKRHEQELQRQNERLSDLTSILSHDLRNPLTVAMGNLQFAREERDTEELETVSRALERMDELIDGVLAMTRLGVTVQETDETTLSALAKECWANVAMGDGGLTIESNRDIGGDLERLKQVIENLFRNAREHAGPDVEVHIGALENGFYVEDDGPGIPADQRDQVFEPGYSTTTDGTGLGLNIAAEIIEAHGWSIRAADGRDGGARFEITGLESTA